MTWCFAIIPASAVCRVKETAAGSTPSATVAVGGTVMSTKVVFTAVAAGAIGLVFVLGRGTKSIDEDEAKRQFNLVERGSLELLVAEVDGLKTNVSSLKSKQSDAFRENKRLRSENERLREENAALVARADGKSAVGDGETLVEDQEPSVDWDKLSELFRDNRELLGAATNDPNVLKDPLALAKVMAFLGEASKLAEAMRESSPHPFFDPEFLPEIVRAVQGRPLDLSENQLKELTEIAATSLQNTLTDFDVESALPIERLQRRLGVVGEISESMDNILTDAQMDNWSDFRAASESALRGVLRIRDLPIDVELGDSDPVVDHWKTGYSLNDDQVEFATTLANNYRAEAKRILERQQERGQLNDQLLRLQVRMERELLSTLSEEQVETALSSPATLLRFNAEGKSGGKTSGFAGFSF